MAPATRAEAQAKLTTLYVGIGHPETWHDYSAYEVKADDIFGNLWRGSLFAYHREVARLGLPIDRKEWSMTPQKESRDVVRLILGSDLPRGYDKLGTDLVHFGRMTAHCLISSQQQWLIREYLRWSCRK